MENDYRSFIKNLRDFVYLLLYRKKHAEILFTFQIGKLVQRRINSTVTEFLQQSG